LTVDEQRPRPVTLTQPSDLEFRVERDFAHPIERVWAAYTEPDLIAQWWGESTTVDRLDVRVGGSYRFVQHQGSDKESAFSGDFLEVRPPDRIVQTFGMEGPYGNPMTQVIEFSRHGDGTRLAITSRFDSKEERDGTVKYAESGATWGWAKLDALLERLAAGD
jgi:uncharacterized protein YndB with AHSA1/START domain